MYQIWLTSFKNVPRLFCYLQFRLIFLFFASLNPSPTSTQGRQVVNDGPNFVNIVKERALIVLLFIDPAMKAALRPLNAYVQLIFLFLLRLAQANYKEDSCDLTTGLPRVFDMIFFVYIVYQCFLWSYTYRYVFY